MIGLAAAAIDRASVAHIESTLTTIEQLLLFAIPLLTVVGTAYIGLYLHLRSKLEDNNAQLRTIAKQTNGNLEQLAGSVQQLAANTTRAPRRAGDPEPPAEPPTG